MILKPVIRLAKIDDAMGIARVHVDTWRTTYTGIISDLFLAKLNYERSQAGWVEHLTNPGQQRTFIIEIPTAQVVAFAGVGPIREPIENFTGEIYSLYVLKSYQGLGYGKLLVTHAARDLYNRGFQSMVIWVMKENPARQFYLQLGGELTSEKTIEIGGEKYPVVAYTWPDLKVFD